MTLKWCIFCFLVVSTLAINATECDEMNADSWLCNYMRIHNRNYSSMEEMTLRKARLHRAKPYQHHGVKFGRTSRSDRFPRELRRNAALHTQKHQTVDRHPSTKHADLSSVGHLPPIDWRSEHHHNHVTSVKDQGNCGGCFAFASASVLEYWSRRHDAPKSLSSQVLMDCTSRPGDFNEGCEGGLMEYVFDYAQRHPVPLLVDAPWLKTHKKCHRQNMWSEVHVKSYKVLMRDETPHAENQLERILHKYGPVAVGIDSSNLDDYVSGTVRAHQCSTDIDHAVTIVGYTKNAWIIKNSWGPNWGVDGFLYLERGKNACGVAEYIVYITDAAHEHRTRYTV